MNDKEAILNCIMQNPSEPLPLNALADYLD